MLRLEVVREHPQVVKPPPADIAVDWLRLLERTLAVVGRLVRLDQLFILNRDIFASFAVASEEETRLKRTSLGILTHFARGSFQDPHPLGYEA